MAARGVPAHVTVLHPFRTVVDEATADAVEAIAGAIDSFDATFASFGRFADDVVFLLPEPLQRFKQMTEMFVEAFPDCPPYGGAFPDPYPHLTVGSGVDGATADGLERAITAGLPDWPPVQGTPLFGGGDPRPGDGARSRRACRSALASRDSPCWSRTTPVSGPSPDHGRCVSRHAGSGRQCHNKWTRDHPVEVPVDEGFDFVEEAGASEGFHRLSVRVR